MIRIFLLIVVKDIRNIVEGDIYCKARCLSGTEALFLEERSVGYIMDKYSSADIDDQIDYELAKVLMMERQE